MNSCWSNLYDRFKDRRYASLFLMASLVFSGLLIAGALIFAAVRQSDWKETFLGIVPGAILLAVALVWRIIRHARWQREGGPKFPPLSRDEWFKARSKLVKRGTARNL